MSRLLKIFSQCFFIAALCLTHSWSMAQNEVARERSSLKGIQNMSFTVNLEATSSLTQKSGLEISSLREMGQTTLREGSITLIPDNEVERSDEVPFLYLHVNTMDAGQGLVPFAISLYFYQPVKLSLNRDMQTSSVTWESGSLGIVSYDRMNLINAAAKDLLNEFISDYHKVNDPN